MRILIIHAISFTWKVTQKARSKIAEDLTDENKNKTLKDVIVAFTAIEKCDEADIEVAAERGVANIIEVMNWVKAKRIVLYPYSQLAEDLCSSEVILEVLKRIWSILRERGFEVYRLPHGYYTEYVLHSMGHAVSEVLRTIRV